MLRVPATVVRNELEAELACSLLRSVGIECGYRQTNVAAGGLEGLRGGWQEIMVDPADVAAAREVLADVAEESE